MFKAFELKIIEVENILHPPLFYIQIGIPQKTREIPGASIFN
jgi:hypothetical protein